MNTQHRETLTRSDVIDVHSTFRTIQGEGPFAGNPAYFVRLAGCNLQCLGCDTDYTSKRNLYIIEELVAKILIEKGSADMVVITGGEPFRQGPALVAFCNLLVQKLYCSDHRCITVQLETNGTLWTEGLSVDVDIVVSPKTPFVAEQIAERANAFKYVLSFDKVNPIDGLPTFVLDTELKYEVFRPSPIAESLGKIYVQPMDSGNPETNAKNLQAAIRSSLDHGYTLCLQLHKIIGME